MMTDAARDAEVRMQSRLSKELLVNDAGRGAEVNLQSKTTRIT